ncbi:N-acetylmuramoyl-L-alanine amidase [Undibacterium flavidum]|uniref:N-acetylmuramoyl-L-alanine amidase n=1 Tax=Undibacterium flavidum TaxID=2762297 RepID=A0ABR6YAN2_9BURK|nr:N-acetylmuramoyl-L-alanine amidase [Undibacterium flavidum]MBC3873632.1 N-acetylmuramoyl-L-alanine amidase [Undibacterium flavidum]
MSKEQLYTLRWSAMQIARLSSDSKIDALALNQIEILSQLLGESIPEEFAPSEPDRPSKQSDGGQLGKKLYPVGAKKLWYPDAIMRTDLKRPAKGEYPKGYPLGAIVHFTAGQYSKGVENAINSIADSPYFFCCIGTDGKFVQANPLNQWGYHAGESAWVIEGEKRNGVSNYLVGIEITNPGRLDLHNGKYFTYWDKKKTRPIDPSDVRIIDKDTDNILAGAYLPYTKAQEEALIEFLLWAKANNPTVFNFDYVLGHDEVAGPKGIGRWRKNDPGGALSVTMTDFRQRLKDEYKNRYG